MTFTHTTNQARLAKIIVTEKMSSFFYGFPVYGKFQAPPPIFCGSTSPSFDWRFFAFFHDFFMKKNNETPLTQDAHFFLLRKITPQTKLGAHFITQKYVNQKSCEIIVFP